MSRTLDTHQHFTEARDAFLAALANPAGPDAKAMLDELFNIAGQVISVTYGLRTEDDSKCGPTGRVFTIGTTPELGVTYDIRHRPANITDEDLERLDAGWAAVEGRTANAWDGFTAEQAFDMGLELLEELRAFVTDEASE